MYLIGLTAELLVCVPPVDEMPYWKFTREINPAPATFDDEAYSTANQPDGLVLPPVSLQLVTDAIFATPKRAALHMSCSSLRVGTFQSDP